MPQAIINWFFLSGTVRNVDINTSVLTFLLAAVKEKRGDVIINANGTVQVTPQIDG